MDSRTLLLTVHIAGVGAWLGANLLQLAVTQRFAKEAPAVAAAWTRQQMWLGQRFYGAAGAVIAITGVLLVLDGDWSWSSGFIWVGIAVVVIGGVTGVAGFTPLMERRLAALESGDGARAEAAQRGVLSLAGVDTALVLLAVLAMVDKWAV